MASPQLIRKAMAGRTGERSAVLGAHDHTDEQNDLLHPHALSAVERSAEVPLQMAAIAQAQRTVGNQVVARMVQRFATTASSAARHTIQRCITCQNVMCQNGEICGNKSYKYDIGQHGAKKREQKRLATQFGIPVSGDEFESEHTVGFEPLNQTSGETRGTRGRARDLENNAPAYQEVKDYHRDHIGTGTRGERDASGFNSQEYRDSQRALLEAKNASAAVQLNQLGYAFNPAFQTNAHTPESQAATNSFNTMVGGMQQVTYAQGDDDMSIDVTPEERAEMLVSRFAALNQRYPNPTELVQIYKMVGIPAED